MNPLKMEGCTVTPQVENRVLRLTLAGTFDMSAAGPLQEYFAELQVQAKLRSARELVFEVAEVYYLGSSCIKAFVALTANLKAGSGVVLRIVTNPRLDWQERTFQVLSRLAPGLVTVERKGPVTS